MWHIPPVTTESKLAALAAQRAERAEVTRQTGIRFEGDRVIHPRVVLMTCLHGGCLYVAGGQDEASALGKLEHHLSRAHGMQAPREVA